QCSVFRSEYGQIDMDRASDWCSKKRYPIYFNIIQTPAAYYGTAMRRKTSHSNPLKLISLNDLTGLGPAAAQTPPPPQRTAGRLARRAEAWHLENASRSLKLTFAHQSAGDALISGALVQVCGHLITPQDASL